jgi:hypothetical protein
MEKQPLGGRLSLPLLLMKKRDASMILTKLDSLIAAARRVQADEVRMHVPDEFPLTIVLDEGGSFGIHWGTKTFYKIKAEIMAFINGLPQDQGVEFLRYEHLTQAMEADMPKEAYVQGPSLDEGLERLSRDVVQLARLGMESGPQDVVLYAGRMAYRYRKEAPALSERLRGLLETHKDLVSPLRTEQGSICLTCGCTHRKDDAGCTETAALDG